MTEFTEIPVIDVGALHDGSAQTRRFAMKLTLLGTGTPRPSAERQCTANLLQVDGVNLLFDAGRGVSTQLARIGMHPRDIDHIFITHHHFDHIGNLGDLLLAAWNDRRTEPIHVYGPDGTAAIIGHYFNEIYQRDIEFRLLESRLLNIEMPDIRDLVIAHDIAPGSTQDIGTISIRNAAVEHGHAMGLSQADWPCYGYRITANGKALTISGDTIDCPNIRELAQGADLLLQCCYLAEAEVDNAEKRLLCDMVLASATQANAIARSAKAKAMALTHLSPKSPDALRAVLAEASAGFDGTVTIGEDLMVFDI